MAQEFPSEVILNFTSGMNDSIDPDRLRPDEVEVALNMRVNQTGNAVSREGDTQLVANNAATFPNGFSSEFEATLASGTTRTIMTAYNGSSEKFYYLNGTTPTEITKDAAVESAAGEPYRWVFFNNYFIGVSRAGTKAVKWDGDPTHTILLLDVQPLTTLLTDPIDIAVWNRRLCMIQGTSLFISDADAMELWSTGDAGEFKFKGSRGGDEKLNALYEYQGKLILWRIENGIWEIDPGEGISNTFIIKQLSSSIGCDAPFSIADLGRDLIWFNKAGFNFLSDLRDSGGLLPSGRVSQKIYRTLVGLINLNKVNQIYGVYNSDYDEYMVTVPVGAAQSTNNYVLVLNVNWTKKNSEPSWWPYQYAQNLRGLFFKPSSGRSRIYAFTHTGGIFQLNTNYSDAGTGYTKRLKSKRFSLGAPQVNKYLLDCYVDMYQETSQTNTVTVLLDQSRRSKAFNIDTVGESSLWDVAKWDQNDWAAASQGVEKRFIGKITRDVQFDFSTTSSTSLFAVNKIIQEYESYESDMQQTLSR